MPELSCFKEFLVNHNINKELKLQPFKQCELTKQITIDDKQYSAFLFEEMVETDITTFLTNLKFEEENYEDRVFKETI